MNGGVKSRTKELGLRNDKFWGRGSRFKVGACADVTP